MAILNESLQLLLMMHLFAAVSQPAHAQVGTLKICHAGTKQTCLFLHARNDIIVPQACCGRIVQATTLSA